MSEMRVTEIIKTEEYLNYKDFKKPHGPRIIIIPTLFISVFFQIEKHSN